MLKNLPEYQQI